jgi:hypothetical protein
MKYISIILLLVFSSCMPIAKLIYNVHAPRVESKKDILKFAEKHQLIKENIVALNYSGYINRIDFIESMPNIFLFDKDGRCLNLKDEGNYCPAPIPDKLAQLNNGIVINSYLDNASFEYHASNIIGLNGNPVEIKFDSLVDFHAFIYWGTFLGRMNKEQTKIWEESILNNQNITGKIYKINLDFQESWDKSDIKKLKKGLSL